MVPFTSDTPGFIKNSDLGNKIHCVAFVIDGSTVDVIPEKILKQMKSLQIRMNQRGKIKRNNGFFRCVSIDYFVSRLGFEILIYTFFIHRAGSDCSVNKAGQNMPLCQ